MRSNIDVDVDALFNIDMISSINRDRPTHISAVFIDSTSVNNKKVLLLMEQGEGECFYC